MDSKFFRKSNSCTVLVQFQVKWTQSHTSINEELVSSCEAHGRHQKSIRLNLEDYSKMENFFMVQHWYPPPPTVEQCITDTSHHHSRIVKVTYTAKPFKAGAPGYNIGAQVKFRRERERCFGRYTGDLLTLTGSSYRLSFDYERE